MNTITVAQILDAADDVGIEISPRMATIWITEVSDLEEFDAWMFIWKWIYAIGELDQMAQEA